MEGTDTRQGNLSGMKDMREIKASRCPTCKQKVTAKPARIYATCKKPIELHHKFYFQTDETRTVIRHRNCHRPDLYVS